MLKYVAFPVWSAGPWRLLPAPRCLVSASTSAPSRASLCVTALWGSRYRGWDERGGRETACYSEIGLLLLLISWMNQLMLFCALFVLTQREGGGGGSGQLLMAWQLEFEFSSLCHYYTVSPCLRFLLLQPHSTEENADTHTLHPLPPKYICRPQSYGIGLYARY